jgi:hypothetical protein
MSGLIGAKRLLGVKRWCGMKVLGSWFSVPGAWGLMHGECRCHSKPRRLLVFGWLQGQREPHGKRRLPRALQDAARCSGALSFAVAFWSAVAPSYRFSVGDCRTKGPPFQAPAFAGFRMAARAAGASRKAAAAAARTPRRCALFWRFELRGSVLECGSTKLPLFCG